MARLLAEDDWVWPQNPGSKAVNGGNDECFDSQDCNCCGVRGFSAAGLYPDAKAATQSSAASPYPMPVFVVDQGWPKIPAGFKLGDVSAIAIDTNDNAWVLSRPRSAKLAGNEKAAPAIMIFDPAGNYIRGWGGPGAGYEWPEREHSI